MTRLTGYAPAIVEASGCDALDVEQVEEIMRIEAPQGCLDSLRPGAFDRLARVSAEALTELRAAGDTYWQRPSC